MLKGLPGLPGEVEKEEESIKDQGKKADPSSEGENESERFPVAGGVRSFPQTLVAVWTRPAWEISVIPAAIISSSLQVRHPCKRRMHGMLISRARIIAVSPSAFPLTSH
jgi:hypothetical protein